MASIVRSGGRRRDGRALGMESYGGAGRAIGSGKSASQFVQALLSTKFGDQNRLMSTAAPICRFRGSKGGFKFGSRECS
jgi:hypothetical protein